MLQRVSVTTFGTAVDKTLIPDYCMAPVLLSHMKAAHGYSKSVNFVSSDEWLCSVHAYEHSVNAAAQDHYHMHYFLPEMLNKPPIPTEALPMTSAGAYQRGKGTPYGERETTTQKLQSQE